jgi:AP-1 complex subunit sigma 1/2
MRLTTDSKVVYRRYASLFFITGIESDDNELITLEIVHRYVEILDRYFGNVPPALVFSNPGL